MDPSEKKIMWLDCDPGADDAMAIFLACYSPKIDLLGISTVHGNSSLEKVTKNALRVLRMCGVNNIPVLKGLSRPIVRAPPANEDCFHGESGIDGCELPESNQQPITQDVIHEMYTRIKSAKTKVHFVATGCLTNLATLLIAFPDAKQYIEQISLMGGAVTLGNQTPSAEFNIYSDPEAARMVFHSGLPLAMAPLDLTLQVKVDDAVIAKLESFNSVFGKNVIGFLTFYLQSYKSTYDFDFAPLHDPCAVYYVINPSAFTAKLRNVEIETKSEFSDGRTVVDEYGVTKRNKNCLVLSNMDTDAFWKDMFEALILSNQNSPMNKEQDGNIQNSQ